MSPFFKFYLDLAIKFEFAETKKKQNKKICSSNSLALHPPHPHRSIRSVFNLTFPIYSNIFLQMALTFIERIGWNSKSYMIWVWFIIDFCAAIALKACSQNILKFFFSKATNFFSSSLENILKFININLMLKQYFYTK